MARDSCWQRSVVRAAFSHDACLTWQGLLKQFGVRLSLLLAIAILVLLCSLIAAFLAMEFAR